MSLETSVYCVDVGSIGAGRFGWGGLKDGEEFGGFEIDALVKEVIRDLVDGRKVALGFECPLFIPLSEEASMLTKARAGEGNRPWSAGAGVASLVTGLVQSTWILRKISSQTSKLPSAFLEWEQFLSADGNAVFLWEAMVTGTAKGESHIEDALIAVRSLKALASRGRLGNSVFVQGDVISLIGLALLRAGWNLPQSVLSSPCIVIRSEPAKPSNM